MRAEHFHQWKFLTTYYNEWEYWLRHSYALAEGVRELQPDLELINILLAMVQNYKTGKVMCTALLKKRLISATL